MLLDIVVQAIADEALELLKITPLAVPRPLQDKDSAAVPVRPLQEDLLSRQLVLYFILHINSNLGI